MLEETWGFDELKRIEYEDDQIDYVINWFEYLYRNDQWDDVNQILIDIDFRDFGPSSVLLTFVMRGWHGWNVEPEKLPVFPRFREQVVWFFQQTETEEEVRSIFSGMLNEVPHVEERRLKKAAQDASEKHIIASRNWEEVYADTFSGAEERISYIRWWFNALIAQKQFDAAHKILQSVDVKQLPTENILTVCIFLPLFHAEDPSFSRYTDLLDDLMSEYLTRPDQDPEFIPKAPTVHKNIRALLIS